MNHGSAAHNHAPQPILSQGLCPVGTGNRRAAARLALQLKSLLLGFWVLSAEQNVILAIAISGEARARFLRLLLQRDQRLLVVGEVDIGEETL